MHRVFGTGGARSQCTITLRWQMVRVEEQECDTYTLSIVGLFCLPLLTLHLIVHIVIREQYFYIF